MPQQKRFSDEEQALREALNKRPKGQPTLPGLPDVPPAPPFRPAPRVVGEALPPLVDKLLQIAPELQGQIEQIQPTPNVKVATALQEAGFPMFFYDRTNLMGEAGGEGQPMFIRDADPAAMFATLAHEASHVVGKQHGDGAEGAELLGFRIMGEDPQSMRMKDALLRALQGKLFR